MVQRDLPTHVYLHTNSEIVQAVLDLSNQRALPARRAPKARLPAQISTNPNKNIIVFTKKSKEFAGGDRFFETKIAFAGKSPLLVVVTW
ncbi:MAG: hypothetical protein JXB47_09275 [Anaerolineae bacterium]|nr:hypothetical protein [Anaerolineae bacterium]